MSTPISVVGTIATVPKLIRTGAGVPLCSFRLASSERRYDRERGDWVESGTNWYSVTAFRSLAEHSHYSFQKGDRVLVSGRLRVRNWENKERSGTSVEIEADALGHELRWGTSRFARQAPGQRGGAIVTSLPVAGSTGSPGSPGSPESPESPGQDVEQSADSTGPTAPGSLGSSDPVEDSGAAAWTVPGAGVPASAFEAAGSAGSTVPTDSGVPESIDDDGEELPLAS